MASLEQLQMLDDEETSTSSSDDEEDHARSQHSSAEDIRIDGASLGPLVTNATNVNGHTSSIDKPDRVAPSQSTDDDDMKEISNSHKRGPQSPPSMFSKKRIKLSLGRSFKQTNAKTERVMDEMNNGGTKMTSTAVPTKQAKKSTKSTPQLAYQTAVKASIPATASVSTTSSHGTAPSISAIHASREKARGPPKRSLPLKKKIKLDAVELETEPIPAPLSLTSRTEDRSSTEGTKSSEANGEAVEAVVVGHDEENGGVDAVASVIAQPIKRKQARLPISGKAKISTSASSDSHPSAPKKRTLNATRTVRLPPMSSPGLLVPPGIYRGQVNANGLVAPNVVFAQAMAVAGYTTESRTKTPHRGSSVQREVGDMFDSDVELCLNFPKLVPDELLLPGRELSQPPPREHGTSKSTDFGYDESDKPSDSRVSEDGKRSYSSVSGAQPEAWSANSQSNAAPTPRPTLPERLIQTFQSNSSTEATRGSNGIAAPPSKSRKRRRIMGFSDLAPLSLTLPYPAEYMQRRLAYGKKVNEREKAIIKWQADQEALEIVKERAEAMGKTYSGPVVSRIVIPPIPEPPSPPRLSEMQGMETNVNVNNQHPLYPPKSNFVGHLDKNAFHITEGRYFGLTCNAIADPHFVGPNCPGISGLNASASTGLATASSGGGAGLGGPLLVVPAHAVVTAAHNIAPASTAPSASTIFKSHKLSNPPEAADAKTTTSAKTSKPVPKNGSLTSGTKGNSASKSSSTTSPSSPPPKKKGSGPAVTASASELRKLMEDGGEHAETVKAIIIRGAVHAARAGKHDGRSFRASNVKVYPDVCKAFASYAGMRPCARCKSNKQGSYHCRLRRKHKDVDYDGGDSWSKLAPYFDMPMAELVVKPSKPKT
jgi:hypothetical protein